MVTLRGWTALQKVLEKLKNVSTGTLWNSRKTNANSHSWEGKIPTAHSEQGQLCRKGPGSSKEPWGPWHRLGAAPGCTARAGPLSALSGQSTQSLCSELPAPEQTAASSAKSTRARAQSISPRGEAEGTRSFMDKDCSTMTAQDKLLKTKPGSSMDGGWERTGMSWNMDSSDWV